VLGVRVRVSVNKSVCSISGMHTTHCLVMPPRRTVLSHHRVALLRRATVVRIGKGAGISMSYHRHAVKGLGSNLYSQLSHSV
jgi:hypothetical protein